MSDYKDIVDALDILIEYPDLMEYIKTFNSPDGFMHTTETDIKRKECADRLDELLNAKGTHSGTSWGIMLRGVQSVLNGVKTREYMIEKNNEEEKIYKEFMIELKKKREQVEQEQVEQEQVEQEQVEQHWQDQVEEQVQSQQEYEEQWQEKVEQWQAEQVEFKKRQAEQWQEQERQEKARQAKQEQAEQEQAEQEQAKQEQAKQEQAKQEQAKQEQAKQELVEQWQSQVDEQHAKNLAEFELRVEKANKERAILYEAEYKLHINANC